MKKRLLVGTLAVTVVSGAAVAGAAPDKNDVENPGITAEQALQKAFVKVDGFVKEVELSFEDDENYYEVQIESSVSDYEFNIDAATGKISEEEEQETGESYPTKPVDATSFKEYDTIIDQVNAEMLSFHLVTDNTGNRVMFLLDEDGKKRFKTIFTKYDSHLEIIDMNGGKIYNGNL